MKKIISCILLMTMIFTTVVPMASADTAGEKVIDISVSNYKNVNNATYSGRYLNVGANGSVTYDVYIPFQAASIDISYQSVSSSTVTANIGGNTYTADLSGTTGTIELSPNLLKGQYELTLSFNSAINLSTLKINRAVMLSTDATLSYEVVPTLTSYEKAIQTAVILSSQSPVFLVNGGRRYVNNEDAQEVPYVENGEIYLPIHSFSRAMGYYYEQKGSEWVLIKNQYTFHYKNSVLTKQIHEGTPETITNVSKVVNSKLYIPLKYFAELEGKVVRNSGNIYIVEYLSNADAILNNTIFSELSTNFNSWAKETKTGKTYYVSKACVSCDENDGSERKPFKTIAQASSVAQPGDTIIIKEGTYYEVIAPVTDGTVSNPITYKAEEGKKVTISAIADLGSPVAQEGGLLVYEDLVDLGLGRNQLFYNNEYIVEGRYPNDDSDNQNKNIVPADLSNVWPVQGNMSVRSDNKDNSHIYATDDTLLNQADDYWVGGTVTTLEGMGWTLGTGLITDSTSGSLTIGKHNFNWWFGGESGDHDSATDYAFITNHKNTIDLPGEWAHTNGKFYIKPPVGETAETLRISQKVRQLTIDLTNRKYIRIEGIDTIGGGIKMNNSEMCMLDGGEYKYISHYSYTQGDQKMGNISATSASVQTYPNKSITSEISNGELGIYVSGKDNIIINNSIEYSAAAAIVLTGLYTYIEENYISDCGYMGSYVSGIVAMPATTVGVTPNIYEARGGHAIYQNTMRRAGRRLFGLSTFDDVNSAKGTVTPFIPYELAYNDIYDGSLTTRDTGNIYSYGVAAGTERLKSKDHHNVVWDSWQNKGSKNALYYYDGNTSMFESYNNVLFQTDERVPVDHMYIQDYAPALSVTKEWNNSVVGYLAGGKASLTKDNYPQGKMFKSGATRLTTDTTPYINNVDTVSTKHYKAKNATLTNGQLVNGLFVPNADGAVLAFNNVDFGTIGSESNSIDIYFKANPLNTGDKVKIIVGNSLTDYTVNITKTIKCDAPDTISIDTESVDFVSGIVGTKNVYLVFEDYVSMNVEQIRLKRVADGNDRIFVSLYADDADTVSGSAKLDTSNFDYIEENDGHRYYGGLSNASFIYNDVEFAMSCNEFAIKAASVLQYVGQTVKIYIDGNRTTGTLVGTYTVPAATGWTSFREKYIQLSQNIPAGTHQVCIFFEASNSPYRTTNFLWCGFGNNPEYNN